MTVTLAVAGQTYRRWTGVRIKRALKAVAAGFQIETPGEVDPPILPFSSCTIADDGDLLLTGYVDEARIEVGAHETRTRITGRSKTADLVDCMPIGYTTNQFLGSTFDAIARAVAGQFGIAVIAGAGVDIGGQFYDATFEWSETAYRFLERLARIRGILLTDDPQGDLVLATLGTMQAPAPLAMGPGGNVYQARGLLDGRQRYSKYVIRSQAGLWQTGNGTVDTEAEGQAEDQGVARYRPFAAIAESALQNADLTRRSQWEASHRLGAAVTALLSVPEWRAAGQLWQPNQLVQCTVPRLKLLGQMLIGAVEYREDERGRRTELTVALPAAFAPEPLPDNDATWAGIAPPAASP